MVKTPYRKPASAVVSASTTKYTDTIKCRIFLPQNKTTNIIVLKYFSNAVGITADQWLKAVVSTWNQQSEHRLTVPTTFEVLRY